MTKRRLLFICFFAVIIIFLLGDPPAVSPDDIHKEYRVTAILPPENNLFWRGVWSGVRTAAQESSFSLSEYEFSDIENSNMEDAVRMLDIALQTKADGVLLCPKGNLSDAFYDRLKALWKQGTEILILDTKISSEYCDAFIGMNNEDAGAAVARYLCEQGDTGSPVILIHSNLHPETTVKRIEGFYSYMEEQQASFQISELITTSDIPSGIRDILDFIETYDTPVYLVGFTPGYTLNAAYAVSSSHQSDKARVVGLAETAEALQYVADGAIQALFVQDNYDLGKKAVDIMEQLLTGEAVPEINRIDVELVTRENVSDYLETAS